MSRFQTGCGTVDIMMHTLERYFSPTKDTMLTDRIAEGILKSTVEAGKTADREPDNYEARATLMWAGSLSHNGLTSAGRTFMMQVHQMEHELSGMYPPYCPRSRPFRPVAVLGQVCVSQGCGTFCQVRGKCMEPGHGL